MNLRHAQIVLSIVMSVNLVSAEPSAQLKETADRLASSIYTGPAMRTLRELSDGFGGRVTGSAAYNHAAEWAAEQFRSYGIQNVKLEPFKIENGWVRERRMANCCPRWRVLCTWNPSAGRLRRRPAA